MERAGEAAEGVCAGAIVRADGGLAGGTATLS
jgi:hypothetical protein